MAQVCGAQAPHGVYNSMVLSRKPPPAISTLPLGQQGCGDAVATLVHRRQRSGRRKTAVCCGCGRRLGDEDDEPPPHPARTIMKERRTTQQAIAPALRETFEFTGLRSSGAAGM